MIVEVKGVMRCEAGMGRMVCSPYVGGRRLGGCERRAGCSEEAGL